MQESHWFYWIAAIYWIGVFTGHLSQTHYTNDNADTFIHSAIAIGSIWMLAKRYESWRRQQVREEQ